MRKILLAGVLLASAASANAATWQAGPWAPAASGGECHMGASGAAVRTDVRSVTCVGLDGRAAPAAACTDTAPESTHTTPCVTSWSCTDWRDATWAEGSKLEAEDTIADSTSLRAAAGIACANAKAADPAHVDGCRVSKVDRKVERLLPLQPDSPPRAMTPNQHYAYIACHANGVALERVSTTTTTSLLETDVIRAPHRRYKVRARHHVHAHVVKKASMTSTTTTTVSPAARPITAVTTSSTTTTQTVKTVPASTPGK